MYVIIGSPQVDLLVVFLSLRDEETEAAGTSKFVAHVPVPSQAEVEQYLIQRRRQVLSCCAFPMTGRGTDCSTAE